MKRRKSVEMTVRVTVPITMSARDARREVRSLISHQANWRSDMDRGDVKAIKVSAASRRWVR